MIRKSRHIKGIAIALPILSQLLISSLQAQNPYSASTIPDSLLENADKVLRAEQEEFEVSDIDHARIKVHKVITILKERGKGALKFGIVTDKFRSLADFEAKLYDGTGKQIEKFKQRDLSEFSISEDLVDDGRNFHLAIHAANLPVTVEYDYEIKEKGMLSYPEYEILDPDESLESSSFTARVNSDLDLRYMAKNIDLKPLLSLDGRTKTYTWHVSNLKAVRTEEGALAYSHTFPSIILAPNKFKLGEFEGNLSSWQKFGSSYASLVAGTDDLTPERRQFFEDLVKNAKTDREKARIIYQYLQRNFRYVSIKFGVGGYKPLPASFTDTKKFGDCKGLSNYMQTALKAVGIKSYLALINSETNEPPVDPSFPYNGFDHVILCVILPKDSIWLECTGNTSDFGVLGSFTENRNALLITESGGVLVPTPKTRISDNTLTCHTSIQINEDGSGKTTSTFSGKGEFKQMIIAVGEEKSDDQKRFAIRRLGFKDPSEITFSSDQTQTVLSMTIDQNLEKVPELKLGSKMFLAPRVYKFSSEKLPKSEKRLQDYYFDYPYDTMDTTAMKLVEGYKIDALPGTKNMDCEYATYSTKYWFDEKSQTIFSSAQLIIKNSRVPASKFSAVKSFFDDVIMDSQQRIVISKK
jgi:hypothetical protein